MNLGIQGRRALIAGSSSGIGASIARMLAKEGVEVIVHGRNPDNVEAVVAKIRAEGGVAHGLAGMLDDPKEVEQLSFKALEFGSIDILVNSAGAASVVKNWLNTTVDDWQRQYQFSTIYAVQLIQALVPQMRDRGWGRILNLSSAASFKSMALHPEYAAAKLALHTVAGSLACELKGCGVTVNTLVSGLVMTSNTQNVMKHQAQALGFSETGEALEKRLASEAFNIPLGRAGKVDEIAAAACFLVSEPAAYITASSLRVDGGGSGFVN